jgi:hypothetical protein
MSLRVREGSVDFGAAALLSFVLPGVQHELGNALFAIRGHAETLGGASMQAARTHVLRGCERAEAVLAVLRVIGAAPGEEPPVGAGVLLQRLAAIARVPLRDRGLLLDVSQSSTQTPVLVDGAIGAAAVLGVFEQLGRCVPLGFSGALRVDLARQSHDGARIVARIAPDPAQLPFPLDLERAVQSVHGAVGDYGVALRVEPPASLVLELPAAAASSSW